jgi:dTMP kinase
MNKKGLLITFEGPEGGGKTTIFNQLKPWVKDELAFGDRALFLHEPGGTPLGEEIRTILLNNERVHICSKSEALLFQAARAELCQEVISPAIKNGYLVFLDRFQDSSIFYQGYGRDLGVFNIDWLNKFSTGGMMPDLTLFLDINPETGLTRKKGCSEGENRLDKEELAFHKKVYAGSQMEIKTRPEGRWKFVDAGQPLEAVIEDVQYLIANKLRESKFLVEGQISKEYER